MDARSVLILIVGLVWAVGFTAPIFVPGYDPPPEVHIIFMAIMGVLLYNKPKPPSPPRKRVRSREE